MADLTSLPLQLDEKKGICRAIIETPKGFRNKFDYDRDSGLFMLGGLLPEGMMFPFDFGFIPSTLGRRSAGRNGADGCTRACGVFDGDPYYRHHYGGTDGRGGDS